MGCSACQKAQQQRIAKQSGISEGQSELCKARRIAIRQLIDRIKRLVAIERDINIKESYRELYRNYESRILNKFYCPSDADYLVITQLKNKITDEFTKFGLK